MKKLYILLCVQFITQMLFAQLNGSYTIGGTSPDYVTIQSAINDLTISGVSGPTTFLIRNGNYTEQLNFKKIPGIDSTKRVTFQSENQDSSLVNINYAAAGFSDNWVVQFDTTEYVTLKWLTIEATGSNSSYTNVVEVKSQSNYVTIENCFLQGKNFSNSPILYAAQGSFYEHVQVLNNHFYLGGIAIQMRNDGGVSFPNGQGLIIENNLFDDNAYGAISLINHDFFEVKNNTAITPSQLNQYYDAFYFSNVVKGGIITGNSIIVKGRDGITLNNCKNPITAIGTMYNNFVSVTGTASGSGLSVLGSPVVSSSKTSYWNIYDNTVIVDKSATGYAFNIYKSENNNIYNNIFYNNNVGCAIYNNNSSTIVTTTMDYNVLFSVDSVLGVWNLNNYLTFASFQSASASNVNSLNINPGFSSINDYHLCNSFIDDAGSPLFSAINDLDGDVRSSSNPDIGADEFNSTINNSVLITGNTLTSNQTGATYQWIDCGSGNPIPGETNQSYIATSNGDYAVIITMGICSDTSVCTNIVITDNGNMEQMDKINIYPNPTNNYVNVDFGKTDHSLNYSITTIDGKVIDQEKNMNAEKIKFDLSNYNNGIYFLKVNDFKSVHVYKIIKRKFYCCFFLFRPCQN